jgi:tetraspanin-7
MLSFFSVFISCLYALDGKKISGLAFLCSGIWVQIGLHRYMELSTDYTNTFQIVLVAMGLIILFVGTLACCCTVKAESSLLYAVRIQT